MQIHGVNMPAGEIATLCDRFAITRLSLFGSILRPDFQADSDVDVLVEFAPGRGPSLLGFAGIQIELSRVIGRAVHLHTPSMLPPSRRAEIASHARVQYAA